MNMFCATGCVLVRGPVPSGGRMAALPYILAPSLCWFTCLGGEGKGGGREVRRRHHLIVPNRHRKLPAPIQLRMDCAGRRSRGSEAERRLWSFNWVSIIPHAQVGGMQVSDDELNEGSSGCYPLGVGIGAGSCAVIPTPSL